jgi:ZIP family zinc transporter
MEALLFSLGTFISTGLGGLFGLRFRAHIHHIISFTAGVLIGVTFFDIIPEIFEITAHQSLSITPAMVALVGGFFAIHVIEKLAVIHTAHEHEYAEHHHPLVGYVGASGLAVHSLLDGVGIGLGFHVSPHMGLLIALAVIAHDFSDGLNTVSLLLINKSNTKRALTFLFIDALAPILGVVSTFLFSIPDRFLVIYLGFFGGFLLYLGASDLLPEAHSKHSSYKLIGLTVLGALLIFLVTRLT